MIVALGLAVFHVPFRGNPFLLLLLSFFFLVGSLGLGIFISATARSQVLATQEKRHRFSLRTGKPAMDATFRGSSRGGRTGFSPGW